MMMPLVVNCIQLIAKNGRLFAGLIVSTSLRQQFA